MKMTFTDEQQMLQETAKKFFEKEAPIEQVRTALESVEGHDAKLWRKMANAGWLGINVAEEYDGADGTLVDLAIVVEQAGRSLIPSTLYSTIYATLLLNDLATTEQKSKYLPALVAGSSLAAVAFEEQFSFHNMATFQTTATQYEGGWKLDGEKYFVTQAHQADTLFVIAKALDKYVVLAVDIDTQGVSLKRQHTIDGEYFYKVCFEQVVVPAANLIGETLLNEEEILRSRDMMTAIQSVEMAGGAMKVVEMTVDYVKERKQFGVAIGTFQAVQHHLSNLYTLALGAKLAAYKAISMIEQKGASSTEVHTAKVYASEAYVDITVMAHQLWAGMGYSTESDLFLWSNRAKTTQLTFGTPAYHRKKIGESIRQQAEQYQNPLNV